VGVVALPLALGFAITTGASPGTGLTTAIIAGLVAALFGGSNYQVSGPTGAMTVVLVPIVTKYGIAALTIIGVISGFMIILMAAFQLGR
jgi:SulP family sulfate permease